MLRFMGIVGKPVTLQQQDSPSSVTSAGLQKSIPVSKLLILVLLLVTAVALYFKVGVALVSQWWHDPDYSHGFFVPFLALWILWDRRAKLQKVPPQPNWWGVPIVLAAMGALILGSLGAENFVSRVSILILIAGLVIHFYGWSYFRIILLPWLVLFLMIPLPAIIANRIVLPLQFLCSGLATGLMDLFNIPVYREGNVIHLPSITLEVAEACSGIRSLFAMITLVVAYSYLLEQKTWKRVVLVISAVPIAVLANSVRIMASGVLGQYWSRDKAEGFFHLFSGLVIFSFSFLLLWLLHALLRKLGSSRRQESLA
jgi:exosortase